MKCLLKISEKGDVISTVNLFANKICEKTQAKQYFINDNIKDINHIIENNDAELIIIGINNNNRIQTWLNRFRNIRIPYIFVKSGQTFNLEQIILPITNLIEEKAKGPYASFFARFFSSKIKIYKPNDYGTRADNNINSMKKLFESLNIKYEIIRGRKNSNGIELESTIKEMWGKNKLIIISASREYGLDDIIFGPKEKKIIKKTIFPILVLNPREDLYTLCD